MPDVSLPGVTGGEYVVCRSEIWLRQCVELHILFRAQTAALELCTLKLTRCVASCDHSRPMGCYLGPTAMCGVESCWLQLQPSIDASYDLIRSDQKTHLDLSNRTFTLASRCFLHKYLWCVYDEQNKFETYLLIGSCHTVSTDS